MASVARQEARRVDEQLEAQFRAELQPGTTKLRGNFVWRNSSDEEKLRDSWSRWVASMPGTPRFGTLTLATRHHQRCKGYAERPDGKRFNCEGSQPELRSHSGCRVPGVQRSETLLRGWLALVDSAFVVEEFGTAKGRRHFHYVASGTSNNRYLYGNCELCLAGIPHEKYKRVGTATGYWEANGGRVDETSNKDPIEIANYITKYITKDLLKYDGKHDAPDDDEPTRWWVGGWDSPRGERRREWWRHDADDDADDDAGAVHRGHCAVMERCGCSWHGAMNSPKASLRIVCGNGVISVRPDEFAKLQAFFTDLKNRVVTVYWPGEKDGEELSVVDAWAKAQNMEDDLDSKRLITSMMK